MTADAPGPSRRSVAGNRRPSFVVVGGVNGAGKSTLVDEMARDPRLAGAAFLNPDKAASAALAADPALSRRAADFAGLRAVAAEIGRLLDARKSLVAETVFANEAYLRLIRRAKGSGYAVRLVFVGVPTVEDAIGRVAARVRQGGHGVAEADIRRRWPAAHANLARAVALVDEALVVSNAGGRPAPKAVAVAKGGKATILDHTELPAVTAALAPLAGP